MARSFTVYELSKLIGRETTQKIIDKWPSHSCYFSNDPMALEFESTYHKHQYIKEQAKNKVPVKEISKKVGLSIDYVRHIINE